MNRSLNKMVSWSLAAWVILLLPERTSAVDDVSIVQPVDRRGDAGLALAVNELGWALRTVQRESTSIFRPRGASLPHGDVILVGHSTDLASETWQPSRLEAYRIEPVALEGQRAILVQGDGRGLMYGVLKLAERIRITGCPWEVKHEAAPAFPLRMFSEEGQLLDMPDIAYYGVVPPYVNKTRLRKEIDQLKQLVDHVVRLGYNTLTVAHVNIEEYIDYRYLDQTIYPPGDPHLQRSPVFCKYLTELCDYAHARHVDVYLQPYEFQYPPWLAELYQIDLGGPDIERIINAWGPWSEKCVSSDEDGTVSWAGHWNIFRTFIDGFTPGQSNAYLMARLAWNPDADVQDIARDFAAVHLGRANAHAAAEALMATEEAFFEYKLGHRNEVAPPNYIKWTMVFRPQGSLLEQAYRRIKPDAVYQSNARALERVRKMEEAFAKTDPSKAPDAERYARFKEGIEKTALYLRTLYLWREGWWRHRAKSDLSGDAKKANAAALADVKIELDELFESWHRFPDEARYWCITFRHGLPECTPEDSFLRWYYEGKTTMESNAKGF